MSCRWLIALLKLGPILTLGSVLTLPAARAQPVERVTGTAGFAQRITLPPTAVFEARVEDVSRADAPATVIGSTRIDNPGNPPIAFSIDVDAARLDPRARYSVRATITIDGTLHMTTDRAYPVLTHGAGRDVALMLRPAGGPRPSLGGGRPLQLQPFRPLPASFSGDLPCADCPALRYRLNLFADGSYFLGTEYVGRRDGSHFDIGRWSVSEDGTTLTLRGGREAPEKFRVVDVRTLRKLDLEGRDIVSNLNYELARTARFEPIEPRLLMRGMYTYLADAGRFTECLTGQTWPVAALEDNATLEREYLQVRAEPGQAILVSLEGQVRPLPPMEGKGTRPTLVVRRFVGAFPRETCGPALATAGLLDTHWVLTALDGAPIAAPGSPNRREASLVLHTEGRRVAGYGGCNRLGGSYTLEGSSLRFGPLAGTMMACADGMDAEKAYLEALARVAGWRIRGVHLELLDAGGAVLARFESRPLR